MNEKSTRDGKEGELYEALWSRDTYPDQSVPGHRAILITPDELAELSTDPRWLNVDRHQQDALRLRMQLANTGFFGTLGDLAVFIGG